jgi:NTP pyrophosphatase (non-canonical NTP hydrolase)
MRHLGVAFDELLGEQLKSQRNVYDVDPTDLPLREAVEYVRMNLLAAYVELGELAHEVEWRPWRSNWGDVNITRFEDEFADVLRHLMNLALVAHVDGLSIVEALQRSWARTAERDVKASTPAQRSL